MQIELRNRGEIPLDVEHLRVVALLGGRGVFAGFATPPAVGGRCELVLERPSLQSAIEYTSEATPQGRVLVDVVWHLGDLVGVCRVAKATPTRRRHQTSESRMAACSGSDSGSRSGGGSRASGASRVTTLATTRVSCLEASPSRAATMRLASISSRRIKR